MKKQRQSVNILISGIRTAKAGILSLFPVDIITADRYTESEDEVITMQVQELMSQKGLTMYRLSKVCNLPYTTINDICSGKARLEKCSAETVYKLAKVLQVPMEELLEPHIEQRCSFELFKSNVSKFWSQMTFIGIISANGIRKVFICWPCWIMFAGSTRSQFAQTMMRCESSGFKNHCTLPAYSLLPLFLKMQRSKQRQEKMRYRNL